MDWLQSWDEAGFRFLNVTLSHPLLDAVMPLFSGNPAFVPALLLLVAWLLTRGGLKGRLFVAVMTVILLAGECLLMSMLKEVTGRPRPFHDLDWARVLVGQGNSFAMPSSHTSIWFAGCILAYIHYPRSWRVVLPLALLVAFSRVYVGVHYPGDVLAGAAIGAGYAVTGLWVLHRAWQWAGPRWFSCWHAHLPSLLPPVHIPHPAPPASPASSSSLPDRDTMWLRAGYVLIAVMFLVKIIYLLRGKIELSEDEAYQWVWSKHLALSYFSKPPLIAYAQFLGTSLWGDNQFGVRFFSPVISVLISGLMLRFLHRETTARLGFWTVAISHAIPLLAVGSTLMTIDPLLVLFWTAAMITGWRAAQPGGSTRLWLWTGLWMGLGFLSKYSALYQIACWALFFALWPPARRHLRHPGPYLALLVIFLCSVPVLIWNAQHDWVTVQHVSANAQLDKPWRPTARYLWDFVGAEFGLMNPVFFLAALWACLAFWKRHRQEPLWIFCFCMGAPVFAGHLLFALYARVQPNWIAPAVLPLVCLMVFYWQDRWRRGTGWVRPWLAAGLAFGFLAVLLLHETDLIGKVTGQRLPMALDPLRRVRGWSRTAAIVERNRQKLLSEGREVFVIGSHYGITSLLSFYMPEARDRVPSEPLVYYRSSEIPKNQFYFWPGYRPHRQGQNALYVRETKTTRPPPRELVGEFESVTDLGLIDVRVNRSVYRRVQLYACRNLLPHAPLSPSPRP